MSWRVSSRFRSFLHSSLWCLPSNSAFPSVWLLWYGFTFFTARSRGKPSLDYWKVKIKGCFHLGTEEQIHRKVHGTNNTMNVRAAEAWTDLSLATAKNDFGFPTTMKNYEKRMNIQYNCCSLGRLTYQNCKSWCYSTYMGHGQYVFNRSKGSIYITKSGL